MNRLFLDTNLVIDADISSRDGHEAINKVLILASSHSMELLSSWHTLSILEYVGKKPLKGEIENVLKRAVDMFTIPSTGTLEAQQAFVYNSGDFEDAMQISSAVKGQADCILTNDKQGGFEKSPIPVLSPEEFLKRFSSV